jgi:hypothetical protein
LSCDGTYGFVCCGPTGLWIGVFTVRSGVVIGRDSGQVTYEGTASERSDGSIDLSVSIRIPNLAQHRQVAHRFPRAFGDGEPEKIFTARGGPLTMMVKGIPDEFAEAATEGISTAVAAKLATAGHPPVSVA